jgi:hypothetical protein
MGGEGPDNGGLGSSSRQDTGGGVCPEAAAVSQLGKGTDEVPPPPVAAAAAAGSSHDDVAMMEQPHGGLISDGRLLESDEEVTRKQGWRRDWTADEKDHMSPQLRRSFLDVSLNRWDDDSGK